MSCAQIFTSVCDWMYRRVFYDRGPPGDSYLRRPRNSFADGYAYEDRYTHRYGPSRNSNHPWDVDNEFRRNPATSTANKPSPVIKAETTGALGSERPAVELNQHFHVQNIGLNIEQNAQAHHTHKFMCTKRSYNPVLVIRRGQPFVLTVHFDRNYDVMMHDVYFIFKTGQFPSPPKRTMAIVPMNETATAEGKPTEWFAKLFSVKDTSINVEITPPCNCIIGEWMFSVHTEAKTKEGAEVMKFQYDYNEDIVVLLNPWCADDQVFMATEGLLDEYILNDSGALYGGNYQQIAAKPWTFGQFEDGILDICLHIVRKAFNHSVDLGMSDSVKLARALATIVNAQDDNGVLVGNWSGNYAEGTSPTQWIGSVAILEEYKKNKGNSVKFGQCWVFSGVLTTVCRAIGLPARSVTNFSSAHDQDASTTIDEPYVLANGEWKKLRYSDSIWNFHVWNEVWMTRKFDLGKGYDGWQVIDATPQERSEGQYRCGPCPVIAVKKGEIGKIIYDAPFVFAEVNADVCEWEIKPNGFWVILSTNTNQVGRKISTKKPDGQPYMGKLTMLRDYTESNREDITHEYKFPEGSLEERLAVNTANVFAKIDRDVYIIRPKDVFLEIIDKDGILVGSDFEIDVNIKNIAQSYQTRTITQLTIHVYSVKYTGEVFAHIATKTYKNITLPAGEAKLYKLPIKVHQYIDHMFELFGMQIVALAHVKETENVHVKTEDYRLRRPDIDVAINSTEVRIGERCELHLSFKNPLPSPLTNCSLMVEGNGIKSIKRQENDVPIKGEWKAVAILEPHTEGYCQTNVSFGCRELKDISGFIVLNVHRS